MGDAGRATDNRAANRVVRVDDVLDRIDKLRRAHADAIEYREALDDIADALEGWCGPDFSLVEP